MTICEPLTAVFRKSAPVTDHTGSVPTTAITAHRVILNKKLGAAAPDVGWTASS